MTTRIHEVVSDEEQVQSQSQSQNPNLEGRQAPAENPQVQRKLRIKDIRTAKRMPMAQAPDQAKPKAKAKETPAESLNLGLLLKSGAMSALPRTLMAVVMVAIVVMAWGGLNFGSSPMRAPVHTRSMTGALTVATDSSSRPQDAEMIPVADIADGIDLGSLGTTQGTVVLAEGFRLQLKGADGTVIPVITVVETPSAMEGALVTVTGRVAAISTATGKSFYGLAEARIDAIEVMP